MRSLVHGRGRAKVSANLTPLIDVAFLLIVFFVLVTRIGDLHRARVELPRPASPASAPVDERRRVVVNLVPRLSDPTRLDGVSAAGTLHGPDRDGRSALAAQLAELYRGSADLRLDVRADRRLEYRYVEPVLRAIAEAAAAAGATPRVNLVVARE